GLESGFAYPLNDVFDLFRGGAVGHVHNHGDDLSVFYWLASAKNKSRDGYRGFGGTFKLSLLPG
ncbi:MAG: hypothetical protein WBV60_15125, partial [Terriglobales bacterium]